MTVEISKLITTSITCASSLEVSRSGRGGRVLLGTLLRVDVTAESQEQTGDLGFA